MANRFLAAADDDQPPVCPGCTKIVYPKDRPVSALKGQWHPQCLKCATCKTVLSVRSLESYENQPYCRAHRPTPSATQIGISERADVQRAMSVPKAAKKEQGINKTERMTFAPGAIPPPGGNAPHRYTPPVAAANNTQARKMQGVNKTERMTFAPGKQSAPPVEAFNNLSVQDTGSVYDNSYDQAADQSYDQSGYDQSTTEQPYAEQSYEQPAEGIPEQSYDQTYDQQSYDQTAEGGYTEQGYDQTYDQQGYDQQAYDQQGYDEQSYDQNQQYDENQQAW